MKGLIIKDAICLKKNLKMFAFVTFGVIALAVMYVISLKCGNMADIVKKWNGQDTMSKEVFLQFSKTAIELVLIIPMAFAANVIDCFKEDRKANFNNTLLSMPVNTMEIVGARYMSLFMYVMLGFICSAVSGICISTASEDFKFYELFSVVLMFAGIMIIYMSIVMPCLYYFGTKRADIICFAPFVAAVIGFVAVFGQKITDIPEESFDTEAIKMMKSFTGFITTKGLIFMGVGLVCIVCAYFISVKITKSNRGINL